MQSAAYNRRVRSASSSPMISWPTLMPHLKNRFTDFGARQVNMNEADDCIVCVPFVWRAHCHTNDVCMPCYGLMWQQSMEDHRGFAAIPPCANRRLVLWTTIGGIWIGWFNFLRIWSVIEICAHDSRKHTLYMEYIHISTRNNVRAVIGEPQASL